MFVSALPHCLRKTIVQAHGLWLSAFDASGGLKTSIASYGKSNDQYDYYPGPIYTSSPSAFSADRFGKC